MHLGNFTLIRYEFKYLLCWEPEVDLTNSLKLHFFFSNKAELECGNLPPVYQQQKQGEGFTVFSAKGKAVRNPTARWLKIF